MGLIQQKYDDVNADGYSIGVKVCTGCQEIKSHSCFAKCSREKSGLQSRCKPCRKKYHDAYKPMQHIKHREWKEKNLERYKANNRAYYLKNLEKMREKTRLWAAENRDHKRQSDHNYYLANKEALRDKWKRWEENNQQRLIDAQKDWLKKNAPAVRMAKTERRRAIRLRTPKWADKTKIRAIYAQAFMLEMQTGIKHHVDHIIPIKSHLVCGLHCEFNLRAIPAKENLSKKNKLIGFGNV
jgi:hypothetical protein